MARLGTAVVVVEHAARHHRQRIVLGRLLARRHVLDRRANFALPRGNFLAVHDPPCPRARLSSNRPLKAEAGVQLS